MRITYRSLVVVWIGFFRLSLLLSVAQSFVPLRLELLSSANPQQRIVVMMKHQKSSSDDNLASSQQQTTTSSSITKKRIAFVRHGQTYMNEYINGTNYGGPAFSDIFPNTSENNQKYPDSPLSPTGIQQAKNLHSKLEMLKGQHQQQDGKDGVAVHDCLNLSKEDASCLEGLDLVVVSPLTRALQTLELGLYPHIQQRQEQQKIEITIVATPLAAERVYLISDLGKSRGELKKRYPYIDFDSAFPNKNNNKDTDYEEPWHFTPSDELVQNYVEWRPQGKGQRYACLGEPQEQFDERMSNLYRFLQTRDESNIAVVCHAGVIEWYTQEVVDNCEVRVIPFDRLKPRGLIT